jgi:hypothetical protein
MARYRPVDTQPKFVAIDLAAQLLPGTCEHALHHLLEQAIDLTPFDARYRNDTTGAPAYAPGMLLRVVLFAYSRGIMSIRAIAHACEEPVTFIALSGDSRPHFTTIAHWVSTVGDQIAPIFAAVLAIGDRQGLIGREMFCDRWREAAEQCVQASKRDTRRLRSAGREDGARGGSDARAASGRRRAGGGTNTSLERRGPSRATRAGRGR